MTWEGFKKLYTMIWQYLRNWCTWIFFEVPIRKGKSRGIEYHHLRMVYYYLKICWLLLWGVPFGILAIWYILVQGCSVPATRHHLGHFCIGPFENSQATVPWYIDLWTTHNLSEVSLSPEIEYIMTSSIQIDYTKLALLKQRSELRDLDPSIVSDHAIKNLDRLIELVSDLHVQFENFSRTFCLERDIMNHAFRGWVDTHIKIIAASSDFVQFSVGSTLAFPLEHGLRFINHFCWVPFMPQPKLYSVQVKAELRFQKNRFLENTMEALGNIDSSLLPTPGPNNSSLAQLLEVATDDITTYQHNLNHSIDTLRNSNQVGRLGRAIFGESKKVKELQQFYALGSRIRTRFRTIRDIVEICGKDSKALKVGLHHLRRSVNYAPDFDFSRAGLISIPPSLSAQTRSLPFSWQQQSRVSNNNGGSKQAETPPSYDTYKYDLDMVDDTDTLTRRDAIAQLCEDRADYIMISGFLYTACNIWSQAKLMSNLDDGLLSGVQRSWVAERGAAMRRYDEMTGSDVASIVRDVLRVPGIDERDGPVPYFL